MVAQSNARHKIYTFYVSMTDHRVLTTIRLCSFFDKDSTRDLESFGDLLRSTFTEKLTCHMLLDQVVEV